MTYYNYLVSNRTRVAVTFAFMSTNIEPPSELAVLLMNWQSMSSTLPLIIRTAPPLPTGRTAPLQKGMFRRISFVLSLYVVPSSEQSI